ncbi:MAG TPA: ROK family protein [Sphingomicrobium sp.]|nr:ROK family protein [Sphingomicrobium sp.]
MNQDWIGGIETGGTKLLARICDRSSGETIAEDRWETSSAAAALHDLAGFLMNAGDGRLVAVGMAAFGPLIIDPDSPDYGLMQATTKQGWTGSNLRTELEAAIGVAVAVDTDVNAAAIAEQAKGAGKGLRSVAYVTVGTGIGAGLAINGQSLKGAMHPEAGHLPIIRRPDDRAPSTCQFHPHCAEGLVSGPAIRGRLGEGRILSDDPAMMELVADYLGQLGASLVMTWSPHLIVWGGGAISGGPPVSLIEKRLRDVLGGYGVGPSVEQPGFCVPARLKDAGLEGALLMAGKLASERQLG